MMMMKQLIFFLVLVTVGLLGTLLSGDDNVATADVFLTHKFGFVLGHELAANVWGHENYGDDSYDGDVCFLRAHWHEAHRGDAVVTNQPPSVCARRYALWRHRV